MTFVGVCAILYTNPVRQTCRFRFCMLSRNDVQDARMLQEWSRLHHAAGIERMRKMKTGEKQLALEAITAKKYAYVPYSHFRVGAALLAESGKIYRGCNIENAAYSPTNCAERTAFFKAVSEGEREFSAIAITGDADDYVYPCGVCRQVMAEFCDPETFQIILVKNEREWKKFSLSEILPGSFTAKDLEKVR